MEESSDSMQVQSSIEANWPENQLKAIELKPSTYLFEQSRMNDHFIYGLKEEEKEQHGAILRQYLTEESVEEEPMAN
jgi:hypothetical protein